MCYVRIRKSVFQFKHFNCVYKSKNIYFTGNLERSAYIPLQQTIGKKALAIEIYEIVMEKGIYHCNSLIIR